MKFKLNPDLLPKLKDGEVYALVHEFDNGTPRWQKCYHRDSCNMFYQYNVVEYFDSADKVADVFNQYESNPLSKYNILIVSKIKIDKMIYVER